MRATILVCAAFILGAISCGVLASVEAVNSGKIIGNWVTSNENGYRNSLGLVVDEKQNAAYLCIYGVKEDAGGLYHTTPLAISGGNGNYYMQVPDPENGKIHMVDLRKFARWAIDHDMKLE